jgi:hypothetical protein
MPDSGDAPCDVDRRLLPTISTFRGRLSAAGLLAVRSLPIGVEPRMIRVDLDEMEAEIIHTVPTVES